MGKEYPCPDCFRRWVYRLAAVHQGGVMDGHLPEPQRQDFKTEKDYNEALDRWIEWDEKEADKKLKKFLHDMIPHTDEE